MMDSITPIDVSSDSDIEIQEPVTQAPTRVNPPWLTTGSDSYHRRGSSLQQPHFYNGGSSNANSNAKLRPSNPASSNGTEASSHLSWSEDPKNFTGNGNFINSRIANVVGADYEKLSSQQALKRTLPPSVNLSTFSSRPGGGNSSQFREAYSGPPVSALGNKGVIGDRYGGAPDGNSIMLGINGVRVLPPSLAHGTSASSSHYTGSSDTMHRFGIGEHRNSGNDERLIYQAALQDLNLPKAEAKLPEGLLSVPLLRHQKIALAWMLQKETRSLHCLGGILADDQGLGKTISMIALIQLQKLQSKSKPENSSDHKTEALDLDADDEAGYTKNEGENEVKPFEKPKSEGSSDKEVTALNVDGGDKNGSSVMVKVKDEESSTSTQAFNRKRPAAGTLVVCPASVLRQWARELDEKVADESKLSVLIYHGGNRTKDPVELAKYDVVLTTYSIVTNEVPKQPMVDEDEIDEKGVEKYGLSSGFSANRKRKNVAVANKKSKKRGRKRVNDSSFDYDCGALARVGWFRVILDEAQTIKNHRTQVARACCSLRAKRRWCLSGTPIQNTIDDLYSYFRFLKYDPYAVYKSFCHTIKLPISKNSFQGYKKLQAVLRAIMLRRTKGTLIDGEPIIKLPPKTVRLTKVEFSVEERSFYRQLEADSRSQFKAYAAAGTVHQNYANILLMLLRLRQACDHPQLVKGYNSNSIGRLSEETVKKLPREARVNLLNRLESSSAICCVCHDPPEDPVVTLCGHVFCYQCVSEYITGDENICPVPRCREQLGHDVVFSESTLRSCISDDSSLDQCPDRSIVLKSEYSSSKIKAVLDILQSLSKPGSSNSEQHSQIPSSLKSHDDDVTILEQMSVRSPPHIQRPIKTIIFSQWTGMLNLVEFSLIENGIDFRRLDGTMSLAARDRAVKDFSNDPDVKVMLMSLKAGNLGLNMVAACHVILLDLWWNPTTEDQAVDRAHRIGQTRPVTVTRITIKDTVEDRILALQEEKRKMVASAFGEDQGGSSAARLTVDDLKYLFMV